MARMPPLNSVVKRSYLYIGTLTVLTSLAIDPFAQQIVQNRQKEFLVDDVAATVAKAGRYSKGSIDFLQAVKFDPCELLIGTVVVN